MSSQFLSQEATLTTLATIDGQAQTSTQAPVSFAWLEITPNCQLTCEHCYVASRPGLGHGKLSVTDWKSTMDSLRSLGVQQVQFIGGEPTTHPDFCDLVAYAAAQGFSIEIYSNLVGITQRMWDCFTRYQVRIATSFYSTEARIHDAITHLPGSYQKTLGNIEKVLALGLILRVGIIHMCEDQDVLGTKAFLTHLGVDPNRIGVDRVRGVGRGYNLSKEDAVSALCGKCVSGRCVITAEGTVYPCIMARSFPLGSVLEQNIEAVLTGETFASTREALNTAFAIRRVVEYKPDQFDHSLDAALPNRCEPDNCSPEQSCGPVGEGCGPSNCGPSSKGYTFAARLPVAEYKSDQFDRSLDVEPPSRCSPDNCGPDSGCSPDSACGPDSKDYTFAVRLPVAEYKPDQFDCNLDIYPLNRCDPDIDCNPDNEPEPKPPCGPDDCIPCTPKKK